MKFSIVNLLLPASAVIATAPLVSGQVSFLCIRLHYCFGACTSFQSASISVYVRIVSHHHHIIFSSFSKIRQAAPPCPAPWEVKTYAEGDEVGANGRVYECKAWPFDGLCGQHGFEPGRNPYGLAPAWSMAWTDEGPCDGSTPTPVQPYELNARYKYGDVVSNQGKQWRCKAVWPDTFRCGQAGYTPGEAYNGVTLYQEVWEEALMPTASPSHKPSLSPSESPSNIPSSSPSEPPSNVPSASPSNKPSLSPSESPSGLPSNVPSASPSDKPTLSPSESPTAATTGCPGGWKINQPYWNGGDYMIFTTCPTTAATAEVGNYYYEGIPVYILTLSSFSFTSFTEIRLNGMIATLSSDANSITMNGKTYTI